MRVLHIISRMSPEGGGPQEVVRLLLRHAPDGCEQEVVTFDDLSTSCPDPKLGRIHTLGPEGGLWPAKLTAWLQKNLDRFDGVMVHGLWEPLAIAVLTTVRGKKPYAVFVHGMLDPYFKHAYPLKHLKKWIFWMAVQYWVLRGAHRVLFTTAAEAERAELSFWLHRWHAVIVPIGTEPSPPDLHACAEVFLDRFPALRGQRYLLFLGRIDPKKGCDLLIDAYLSTLQPRGDGLQLVLAGPDPLGWMVELDERVIDNDPSRDVYWTGMLTGDAKWGAFAACEAFVLPSHQENFGIAVVEALACGKPALISQAVSIAPDLQVDGCALVEADTLEGTRRLLTRWLALTTEERAAMAERARQSFSTRYDMRRNAAAILDVFADAALPLAVPPAEVRRV